MANTTIIGQNAVEITGLDSDWDGDQSLPDYLKGAPIDSIQFSPSGANDVFQIHAAGKDGPRIMMVKCTGDTDQRAKYYYNGRMTRPYIAISECTFSAAASAMVIIVFAPA